MGAGVTISSIQRRKTISVNIGGVPMGSEYPVRIQSMANTSTSDVAGSVEQSIRIIKAGADYVRFTVPSLTDVNAFAAIKQQLRQRGYTTPVIADVHFNPEIALAVAEYADKVRINPGNFTDPLMFIKLLEKCRKFGTAIRIGVNHGSLAEKIMDKFGDTPSGMAESAMEFLRICRDHHFDQVVVSMKASNVRVMVYATRLTAALMQQEEMHFPLHLGVTEAGEGEDGRIKSAIGIGTLLAEGLGDTIRVSLTEDPEAEIPVANTIVKFTGRGTSLPAGQAGDDIERRIGFYKRVSRANGIIGGRQVPVVIGFDKISDSARLIEITDSEIEGFLEGNGLHDPRAVQVFNLEPGNVYDELYRLRMKLDEVKADIPVIFKLKLAEKDKEDFLIKSSVCLGGAFIDGFGDGIWLTNRYPLPHDVINAVSLGILQACRARMSKTEYISCPSCGRTHFNLMEALARIKGATSHLKGLKIGVMGCIVNGPGEMADADYGYVGAGKRKITLYKAREVVKKGIPEEDAVEELVSLIKENGDWVDP